MSEYRYNLLRKFQKGEKAKIKKALERARKKNLEAAKKVLKK